MAVAAELMALVVRAVAAALVAHEVKVAREVEATVEPALVVRATPIQRQAGFRTKID
jgi:hypothetical protein